MWRSMAGACALVLVLLGRTAFAQSYEELQKENQQLRARIRELEAKSKDEHKEHAEKNQSDHDHDAEDYWRWEDPVYPGWCKPTDDYRPGSWRAPPSEGFCKDLFCGRFVETHRSTCGTPWVHPFTIEPAQIHRDAFFFYKFSKNAEGGTADEHENEFHLDWGLTRRFGFTLAMPVLGLVDPQGHAAGVGDIEFSPRVVLIESEKFFLASNVFMTFPTGDERRDLGRGEMTIAPFLTTWHDLGNWAPWHSWNTLQINVGPEFGLRSNDKALLYTAVFAHSFLAPRVLFPHQHNNGHTHGGHGDDDDDHGGTISAYGPIYPIGLTSLTFEVNGQTACQGERRTLMQLLTGVSYVLTETAEIRFGVDLPLNHREAQTEARYVFAFTYIF